MPADRHALLLLPPDPSAAPTEREHRLPPQGAALVAAVAGELGLTVRAVDLQLSVTRTPLADPAALQDDARLWAAARGGPDPDLVPVLEDLLGRLGEPRADVLLVSLERPAQLPLAALLAVTLKRRLGRPVALGGPGGGRFARQLAAEGVCGIDVATAARTPAELRLVLDTLLQATPGRCEAASDPLPSVGPPPTEGWPLPDFGIYELEAYRGGPDAAGRTPPVVLPYTPAFGCAFRCAFCQDPQPHAVQPIAKIVADLTALGERWGVRDFLFLSCQLNGPGAALARALCSAGLDLRWTDSWRVTPSPPGIFADLAAGGCAGLTFGVESASRRVLQRMRKGHRPEDATRVVREAAAAGLFTRVNLLPCFPGETADELAETVAWVRENAWAIDDLAPSAFYLEADSPLGRDPARFGLRVRGPRALHGPERSRRPPGVLAYDEIGGLAWEEREATLGPAEQALRDAWAEGRRASAPVGGLDALSMLTLHRRHGSRAAGLLALAGDAGGGARPTREPDPAIAPLRDRLGPVFPASLQAALRVRRDGPALLVEFEDGDAWPHVLEARPAAAAPEAVARGPQVAWSYREPGGPDSAARFVGSYRRLFERLAAFEADVAAALLAGVPATPPAAGPDEPGEAEPHVRESSLAGWIAADGGAAGLAARLAELVPAGRPVRLSLVLENDCDQACEFCDRAARRGAPGAAPAAPAGRPDWIDAGGFDALLAALEDRRPRGSLCLTGHDWALHPRLGALLDALARHPRVRVALYGPGTRLADAAFAARVLALPGLAEVRLTLHAPDPATHDAISRTPGSGARALRAIRHVRDARIPLRVNAVLTRRAIPGLSTWLAWLEREGLAGSLLAFRADAGPCPFDGADLLAPWSHVRAALEDPSASRLGDRLELLGLPLCAVPPTLRSRLRATWNSPEAEASLHPAACDGCRWRTGCGGVSTLYARTFGAEGLGPERA